MLVHALDPFIQELPLGPIFLRILSFGLQDQMIAVCQADDEVRPVFADHSPVDVQDLESEVIVLDPGRHFGIVVQMEGI